MFAHKVVVCDLDVCSVCVCVAKVFFVVACGVFVILYVCAFCLGAHIE